MSIKSMVLELKGSFYKGVCEGFINKKINKESFALSAINIVDTDDKYTMGMFDSSVRTLTIEYMNILRYSKDKHIKYTDALLLTLAHELGHAMDKDLYDKATIRVTTAQALMELVEKIREDKSLFTLDNAYVVLNLLKKLKPLVLEAEITAYKLGKEYVPSKLHSRYDEFNLSYINNIRHDLNNDIRNAVGAIHHLESKVELTYVQFN